MEHIANHAVMEDLRHSSRLFPISEFVDHFDRFSDGSFPIHWHPELEMQIILRGSAAYTVNGASYLVGGGMCNLYCAGGRSFRQSAYRTYGWI